MPKYLCAVRLRHDGQQFDPGVEVEMTQEQAALLGNMACLVAEDETAPAQEESEPKAEDESGEKTASKGKKGSGKK